MLTRSVLRSVSVLLMWLYMASHGSNVKHKLHPREKILLGLLEVCVILEFMRNVEQVIPLDALPCTRCFDEPRRTGQRWCRHCHARYSREWRAKNQEKVRESNRKAYRRRVGPKNEAKKAVYIAVRSGELVKPSICEMCDRPHWKIDGHHEDYSKPLEVIWVCPPCHSEIHHVPHTATHISAKISANSAA